MIQNMGQNAEMVTIGEVDLRDLQAVLDNRELIAPGNVTVAIVLALQRIEAALKAK